MTIEPVNQYAGARDGLSGTAVAIPGAKAGGGPDLCQDGQEVGFAVTERRGRFSIRSGV